MEFVFNTREEFKKHVKQWGNEPRNYKILEEQNQEQEPKPQQTTTQYFNIQDPTTPEEAIPPTPTPQEKKHLIKEYLKNEELIPDTEYKQIHQILNPEPPEDTIQILDEEETHPQEEPEQTSDTETTTTEPDDAIFKIPDITKQKKQTDNTLNLDIEDDKKYSFYKEITIKEIADNTKRKDEILKRIAEHNLKNDTAGIDFYKEKTNRPAGEVVELSGIFCDNLILSGLTTTSRIKGKNCADCGEYTKGARDYYAERELKTYIKPVGIGDTEPEDITEERINIYKNVILKGGEIKGGFKLQNIKASTADVPFKDILKYTTPRELKKLLNKGLFIHDIDYTQDVAGCINKHKFIDYLEQRGEGFYLEEPDEKRDPHLRIKNNDDTTGRHCLTFIIVKNGMILRIKFYNKFIQSMESGSVRASIGGHVADFVNNPEIRLKDTIKKGLKCGLLRLEISYYCKDNTPTEDDIKEDLTYLKKLLKEAPPDTYFYCSVENQHKQLLSAIKENLIIYDLTNHYLLLCRWWNSETKKINGIIEDKAKIDDLRHTCAFLTFNKPFRLILIEYLKNNTQELTTTTTNEEQTPSETEAETQEDSETDEEDTEEKIKRGFKEEQDKKEAQNKKQSKAHLIDKGASIKINVRRYEKEGQPLTHLTDGKLYPQKTDTKNKNPEEMGLKPYNNITWFIPDKKTTNKRDIAFKRIHNEAPLNLISYKTLKKMEEDEKQKEEDAERVRILKEQTDEQISKDEALRKKAEQLEETLRQTGAKFNKRTAHEKLQDQTKGQKLEITAFYRIETKYGGTYIIYDRISDETYYANTQLNKYIEAVLKTNYNVFNTRNKHNERAFYYLTEETQLITIFYITIKEIKPINDNKTAILINRTNSKYIKEETKEKEQQIKEQAQETILNVETDNKFKVSRDIESADTLEEGKIYYIKYIKQVKQTQRTIYILYLLDENRAPIYLKQYENDPPEFKAFKSNYFIEEQLNKIKNIMELNGQGVKAIQAGAIKLTPNKKRCRVITIRDI